MGFSVLEKPATASQAQYDGKQGQDESRREWGVVSDSPSTADQVQAFAASIARLGDRHPFNPAKVCEQVDIQHVSGASGNSPIAFDVVATYRVPIFAGGKSKDPLQQVAKVSYEWAISEEAIDKDARGYPIMMATGEQFDPPIRRPFGDLVVTVERNVANFDAKAMGDLLFCTNSDTWLGLPPGTALLTKLSANQTINSDGSSYITKTSSVQYRKPRPGTDPAKAWHWRQLAAGYMWKLSSALQTTYLKHSTGQDGYFKAFNSDGSDVTRPVLHDPKTGYPYVYSSTVNLIDYSPLRANPNGFYEFQIYESKPFSNQQIF